MKNNSLTKNYSAEEVVEKNQEMYDIISGRTRENKPCVAIIEYAKKPFLSKEVTYTVAYYAITPPTAPPRRTLTRQGFGA